MSDQPTSDSPAADPSAPAAEPGQPEASPADTFKQGMGLLWKAARATVDEIKTEVNNGGVTDSLKQAGRDLEDAANQAAKALESFVERVAPPQDPPAQQASWAEASAPPPQHGGWPGAPQSPAQPAAKAPAPSPAGPAADAQDDGAKVPAEEKSDAAVVDKAAETPNEKAGAAAELGRGGEMRIQIDD